MKFRYYLLLLVLVLAVSCAGFASAGNQGIDQAVLNDLPPESAANLSLNIATVLHAFSFDKENETWSAYNYGERTGIVTRADGSVLFTNPHGSFGMHLAGLGRGDAIMPVDTGTIVADGRKVELVRSGSSEWYINKDEGFEQGMTITKRPEGTGSLRVLFDLSGTLVPVPDGQNIVLSDQSGPVLRYSGLKAVDATGHELPVVLDSAGTRLSWEIDDRDALYPLIIDPTITEDKILSASDKADYNNFGYSVAVSGDTVVVGARYAASGGIERGQAYVFSRNQGGTNNWGLVMTLIASYQADGDWFGNSVAVSGDTVVVGAPDADSGGIERGQAYVFSRNQGGSNNWGQVKILSASYQADNDYFGISVAVSGDTVVVGADSADSGGTNRGQAYVFLQLAPMVSKIGVFRPITHMFYLKNGTTTTAINWGVSTDLPVTGDWNGDGRTEVGVFRNSTHMFYLKNGTTTTAINWGVSTDLPVTGDWNGDGRTEVGVFRNPIHMFYLKNGTTTTAISWGVSTDLPVSGKW
jgi:hypothetical protein